MRTEFRERPALTADTRSPHRAGRVAQTDVAHGHSQGTNIGSMFRHPSKPLERSKKGIRKAQKNWKPELVLGRISRVRISPRRIKSTCREPDRG